MDFILNGNATGDVADKLLACNFDVRALRPYFGNDGRSYITTNSGGKEIAMLHNADATLTKDAWIQLDTAIMQVAREKLRFVNELKSRGLTYNIPNGLGKTVFQTQKVSDMDDASIDMDGISQSTGDRPVIGIENIPLPIIHKDFSFTAREIQASREGQMPLDTQGAQTAARKVAEQVEKLHLGTLSSFAYGGGTLYGLKNFTSALTKTLTSPASSGWTGETIVNEAAAMLQQSRNAKYYGPWMILHSPAWNTYLDRDYKSNSEKTTRMRLQDLGDVAGVMSVDYLTNYDFIVVQMTSDVVRTITGMDIVTLQWDSHGGMKKNFKVMAIQVPQVKADYNGKTGIVVGSV